MTESGPEEAAHTSKLFNSILLMLLIPLLPEATASCQFISKYTLSIGRKDLLVFRIYFLPFFSPPFAPLASEHNSILILSPNSKGAGTIGNWRGSYPRLLDPLITEIAKIEKKRMRLFTGNEDSVQCF